MTEKKLSNSSSSSIQGVDTCRSWWVSRMRTVRGLEYEASLLSRVRDGHARYLRTNSRDIPHKLPYIFTRDSLLWLFDTHLDLRQILATSSHASSFAKDAVSTI